MTDYKDKIRAAAERFNPLRTSDPMVRAAMAADLPEDWSNVSDAVSDWYASPEHTDPVHVSPNGTRDAAMSAHHEATRGAATATTPARRR